MIGFKKVKNSLYGHKKPVITILASLILVFIVAGGVFWNMKTWHDYESSYNLSFEDSKSNIDKVFLEVLSQNETNSASKLSKLVEVQSKLTDVNKSRCDISQLVKWQGFVKQYADKIKHCEARKSDFANFLVKFNDLVVYLAAEQGLAVIFQKANDQTNQNNQPDKWKNIEAIWSDSVVKMRKLPDTEPFKPVKTLSIERSIGIADAWKRLAGAHEAKDSGQFEEAHANIVKTYSSIQDIGDSSKGTAEGLIVDLRADYDKI